MLFGRVYVTDRRRELPGREGSPYRERALDGIERVIIHHTAGSNRDFTAAEIADYHVLVQGWPGIGYHFLVHPDGRLDYVGDIRTARYHVGDLNASTIGVCLAGDFSREWPTRVALARARQLIVAGIWVVLGRRVAVRGHVEVWEEAGRGPTACPGATFWQWRELVAGAG